jgi:hypothetical protein
MKTDNTASKVGKIFGVNRSVFKKSGEQGVDEEQI